MRFVFIYLLGFYASFAIAQNDVYFQQTVDYSINVKLNDKNHSIKGFESIVYTNNSPDTLKEIYMHLWPNAYKNTETAMARQLYGDNALDFYFSKPEDKGFIDSLDFEVDQKKVQWVLEEKHIDVCKIQLNKALLPGKTITISTPFYVKIPLGSFSRLGHDGQSYQISQWYPKPAVYDKNGWNPMPYLNIGEFYSEYGHFDVKITLPKNYVVAATGDLQNEEEKEWLNYLSEKYASQDTHLESKEFPVSDSEWKTLHYTQNNVHDFAWFADKRWQVTKGEVALESGKKIETWVMHLGKKTLWEDAINYVNDALYYYSKWIGDYPYNSMTAVEGALTAGGGMEYPNVTIVGGMKNKSSLEKVIMHETGHQWFYGVLGSNERLYPWMDEGINSYYESKYTETKYPNKGLAGDINPSFSKFFNLDYPGHYQYYLAYAYMARMNKDQPIGLSSEKFTQTNYGMMVYMKSASVLRYLANYLGEDVFDKALQAYFQKWKFKHPMPEDFFIALSESTGKDLNWFKDDFIESKKKLDYAIESSKKVDNTITLTIKNKGNITSPYTLSFMNNKEELSATWFEGIKGKQKITLDIPPTANYVKIDGKHIMPEINKKNNLSKINGPIKRNLFPKMQLGMKLEDEDHFTINHFPLAGWNQYNRWMLGWAFYNNPIPEQKWNYLIAPMYSIFSNSINGFLDASKNFYGTHSKMETLTIGIQTKQFDFAREFSTERNASENWTYTKIQPYITVNFSHYTNKRNPWTSQLIINYDYILETVKEGKKMENGYLTGNLDVNKSDAIYPSAFTLSSRYKLDNTQGTFWNTQLTIQQSIHYKKKKSIDIRLYAGGFLINTSNNPKYNLRMDGLIGSVYPGYSHDYTYDEIFLGRSESDNVLGQQFIASQGGFKVATPLGQSNNWLAAINLKADAPIPLPVGGFFDYGINGSATHLYNGGVYLKIIPQIFEVYFPLLYSNNITEVPSFEEKSYGEKIRFHLKINAINPLKFPRTLKI